MNSIKCILILMTLAVGIDSASAAELGATSTVTVGDASTISSTPVPRLIFSGYNWLPALPTAPGAMVSYVENPADPFLTGMPAGSAVLSHVLNRPLGKWWWAVAKSTSTADAPASRLQMVLDEKNTLTIYDPDSSSGETAFGLIPGPTPQLALIGRNAAPALAGVPGMSLTYAEDASANAAGTWLMNRSAGVWRWHIATGSSTAFDRLQMRLGADNALVLYAKDGITPSISLTPANGTTPAAATIGGATILTTSSATASPSFAAVTATTGFTGAGGGITGLNATNITTGTLAAARGGAGTSNGILKANGAGVVSVAVAGTDYLNPNDIGSALIAINATNISSGTLPVARGGTNIPVYDIGDILYASAATTLSRLAGVANGNVLLSNGVGVAPSWGKITTAQTTGLQPQGPNLNVINANSGGLNISRVPISALSVTASTGFVGPGGSITALNATHISSGILAAARGGAGTSNGMLKANGAGVVSAAVAGMDYLKPNGSGSALTGLTKAQVGLGNVNDTLDINKPVSTAQAAADTAVKRFVINRAVHSGTQSITTITGVVPAVQGGAGTIAGLLKANGGGTVRAAIAGTDYLTPSGNGSKLLALNASNLGSGTLNNARLAPSVSQFGNPAGTALQVLRRNAANNGYEFATVGSGSGTFNAGSPAAIGATAPNSGAFTTLSATSSVSAASLSIAGPLKAGLGTVVTGNTQAVVGTYNDTATDANANHAQGVFVVGAGTVATPLNALRVLDDGTVLVKNSGDIAMGIFQRGERP